MSYGSSDLSRRTLGEKGLVDVRNVEVQLLQEGGSAIQGHECHPPVGQVATDGHRLYCQLARNQLTVEWGDSPQVDEVFSPRYGADSALHCEGIHWYLHHLGEVFLGGLVQAGKEPPGG